MLLLPPPQQLLLLPLPLWVLLLLQVVGAAAEKFVSISLFSLNFRDPRVSISLPATDAECLDDRDCPDRLACIPPDLKCLDPCDLPGNEGICGVNAECVTRGHHANCLCDPGYEGDPYVGCRAAAERERP